MIIDRETIEKIKKLSRDLSGAFDWYKSPQGYNYWREVHKNLRFVARIYEARKGAEESDD